MQFPSLSLTVVLALRSVLSEVNTATFAFFWLVLACRIFLYPFTFHLYVLFYFKWFLIQHRIGFCFFTHSDHFCLFFIISLWNFSYRKVERLVQWDTYAHHLSMLFAVFALICISASPHPSPCPSVHLILGGSRLPHALPFFTFPRRIVEYSVFSAFTC